ncbi:MAG: TetR/AcrR family transcriptional regulator [Xanthomonadales bacterium]|nr:TetR/AcrR family transcriptional regulator [Xanthomonadales bacterium]
MNRRPRDPEATRHDILEAAERLFAAQGFGSTSLAQIADASDTHKSLILHHFGSKDGLWQAVKERRFLSFVDEQNTVFRRGAVSLDEIRNVAAAYFRLLRDDPVLVQLLTRAELEQDLSCSQYDERRLKPFVDRLRSAQATGILRRDVPPAHLLLILINAITQWFKARPMFGNWSEMQGPDPDGAFLESLQTVFLEGAGAVRPRGGGA